MKKANSLLFGLTFLSVLSWASPAPKKGKETIYKVDTQQSKLVWTGKKVTGEHTGRAPISSGTLVFDGSKLAGGTFDVSLKDLTVTDVTDADKNTKLVNHLKGDDFFNANKYPTAKFSITSATPTGDGNYDLAGKLTIKGITNDIKFPAQIKTDHGKLSATATVTIDRTKYDIRYGSKSFFENIGDKAIYDDFTLDISLLAGPATTAASRQSER